MIATRPNWPKYLYWRTTMGRLGRGLVLLARNYNVLAVICFNSLLLFVVINLIADAALHAKEYLEKRAALKGTPMVYRRFHESLTAVHPGMTQEQINGLLAETGKLTHVYDVYTQFKENPRAGKYVTVDPLGFRHIKDQRPWPPRQGDYVVFMFGGSTTFGYGVRDDLTIASHLQRMLDIECGVTASVYNFGRGNYFSVQERLLFEKLLFEGFVPNMAIFLDGLNDLDRFDGTPAHTKDLRKFMEEGDIPVAWKVIPKLPVVKAVRALLSEPEDEKFDLRKVYKKTPPAQQAQLLQGVVERYKVNKRMIEVVSKEFGVIPVFVWQPVAVHKYDARYSIFGGFDYESHFPALKPGYALMAKAFESHPFGTNFVWAADVQENLQKPLYVDATHYSGEMSETLAKYVLKAIIERGLDPRLNHPTPSQQRSLGH
jgi:hypothetical protein